MTATTMHTPWGWPQDTLELAEGVWRVSTAGHGGLKLSRERWYSLPDVVRDTMLNPTFAEEDCEEPIVRTLLGLGDEREREYALKVAGYFDRYAPALPFLRELALDRTTTSSPTGAATAPTPSDASTPGRKRKPSPPMRTTSGTTGGWRPSSAATSTAHGEVGDERRHHYPAEAP